MRSRAGRFFHACSVTQWSTKGLTKVFQGVSNNPYVPKTPFSPLRETFGSP